MQLISSDTNVWIDFATIQRIELPFRLPYTYIMSRDAINEELLSPPGLGLQLVSYGLVPVVMSDDEFYLAAQYGYDYKRLSAYDRAALAISKCRQITLLTGDKVLRKAAQNEGVSLLGTIGILDQLWDQTQIDINEFKLILQEFLDVNGSSVRLPEAELNKRIEKLNIIEAAEGI
jgi:predicted nucleic acid-binding protein